MAWLRPAASRDAAGSGRYLSSRAASSTLARVETATLGSPRRARLTVATETPAALATCSMVDRSDAGPGSEAPGGIDANVLVPAR